MLLGAIISLAGSVFLLLSAVGLLRMPDAYNRMQAGTKATTLGAILFLGGLLIANPQFLSIPKITGLILFILITNPVAGHVLIRAAHFSKVPLSGRTAADHLSEDEKGENKE
jgi:multicomponent Na+:H+ antiporter subunit G